MKRLIYNIPTGLCSVCMIVVICYLSLSSNPLGSGLLWFAHSDKVAHFIAYFACAAVFLLDYAKFKLPHHTQFSVELALTAFASLIGLMLEIVQLATESRSYDIMDWVADTVGALTAFCVLHWCLLHYFRKYLYGTSVRARRGRHKRHKKH